MGVHQAWTPVLPDAARLSHTDRVAFRTGGRYPAQFQPEIESCLPPQPVPCGRRLSQTDCIARSAPNALGFAVIQSVLKMHTWGGHFRCVRKGTLSPTSSLHA
ncbi:hypothetical protein DICSQDRAFT_139189 [Dichomitus squalens LYAD-421 SS1]|uniref:Uncharacterized protein n=2 Tax=Dichomitus squalens TaxID=114155 RepID=A0A4Q9PJB4_9APHY|nr:uncharacterized protein DICSQDRAFT_139189 [Dichomitus squalens LYAD-421 SS1]EJF58745.1 hypothetical protein DICSQDRAFT_139189 [Dichomitus squalens LYAD-421 SS1]TBU54165.1 hypothetical protein BD310DRAFT_951608 [Dichomitus squalens]